jgi:RNA polymerase sigma factor (sigma-70 family)
MTAQNPLTLEERFELLFRTNRSGVLAYFIRRAASKSDAADLLAETFLIAWRKLEEVPLGDSGRLWLYGVARRVLANYHRHERVEGALAVELRAQITVRAELRTDMGTIPFEDAIAGSLDTLSAPDRELIQLSAWEQLTPAEIASVVGMKPGTVRVRLHRARRILASYLIGAGYPATIRADRTG